MDEIKLSELLERYKNIRLIYFPHWKVAPWEKREKEAVISAFLGDLETYLLKNDWSVEKRDKNARRYQYGKNPTLFLEIKSYVDYFGVHTVYLIEIELIKERAMLWDKVLADGELVFDYLKRMV